MKPLFLLLIILFHITLNAQTPYGIKWQKNYGGSGTDRAWDIYPLSDSGHIVVGYSYSNDGDVSGHHGTTATSDGWIFRLNAAHQIVWQKSAGGSADDLLTNIIKTNDGNYIAMGTSSSADFDLPANKGNKDIWVLKFDISGNILWSKNFGGSAHDSANSIIELPSGDLMIAASSRSIDGQVQAPVTGNSGSFIWNFRITKDGDFIAGFVIGNSLYSVDNFGEDLKLLPDGNILMSVRPGLDPSGSDVFPTGPLYNPWLVKLTPQGQIIWKKAASGSGIFSPYHGQYSGSLQLTPYGVSVVVFGGVGGLADMNQSVQMSLTNYEGTPLGLDKNFCYGLEVAPPPMSGTNTRILSDHSTIGLPDSNLLIVGYSGRYLNNVTYEYSEDAFLVRKNFSKSRPEPAPLFLGGSGVEGLVAVKKDLGSNFVVAGYSNSSDGDLTGNNGGFDAWVLGIIDSVIIQKNIIAGKIYLDNNNNQQFDAGDKPFSQLKVRSSKPGKEIISVPYDGMFINEVDTGNYVTSVITTPFFTVHPVSHNSIFTSFENVDSVDFAVSLVPGVRDYKVSLLPLNELIPAFEARYQAIVSNKGTDTLHNQMATMVKDSRVELVLAVPEPVSQSGDTLKWLINNLVPDSAFKIELSFYPSSPPAFNLGDTAIHTFEVDSAQDLTPADNKVRLEQVSAYYDPNGIVSDYGKNMPLSDYENGKYLSYTIHFQNTGTDTSFNVTILDTLNSKFDPESLEMISSSHSYQLNLLENNTYQWKFNGIALVDSNRNEPLSRGYVSFRVKPVTGLTVGTVVSNAVSIYFDSEFPAATALHEITITASKPPVPKLNGIRSGYCKNEGAQIITIENLSGVGSDIVAEVQLNGTGIPLNGNQFSFNPSLLNTGTNTIKVTFTNSAGIASSETSFNILAPVKPDLDLSSTATAVTDQSPAFTVSVTNPVHTGPNPLYTFAKDKAFTNILQASSSSSSITIEPSVLTVGDNKIYARLETSESCYTEKFAIDSILIVKSAPTGIIDPEFPGTRIVIGPNPFRNSIYVNGLQTSKSYLVTVVNAAGHIVWKKLVRNTDRVLVEGQFPGGMYWLHIMDEKKKRSLGTFSLSH